ncbi:hypothetical protein Barb6XT_01576 [Bacteroidales bacterium Barb6XT]|nr:hypothetical protein Barb6XT_01576 [Bacteroidales bacterium Barb6XT]
MPLRGKRFQPHMQRSGMWGSEMRGLQKGRPCGVLQGRRISAPHAVQRNVGLKSAVLAGLHRGALSVNPHSAFAPCVAEIFSPFGAFLEDVPFGQ